MRLAGRRQRGVTLIELVVSIVVISLAVASVVGVLSYNAAHSADPMIVSQAAAIAEAYLEEITLKPFDDPDGADGESSRADFDDMDDYDGLFDAGAADQFGTPIAALAGYDIAVAVTPSSALPGVPAASAVRIDVRVTRAPWVDFVLTGWRTRL